jgi:hypothetical protein
VKAIWKRLRTKLGLNYVVEVHFVHSLDAHTLRRRAQSMTISRACLVSRSRIDSGRLRDILAERVVGTLQELAAISEALDDVQRDRLKVFELIDKAGLELGRIF